MRSLAGAQVTHWSPISLCMSLYQCRSSYPITKVKQWNHHWGSSVRGGSSSERLYRLFLCRWLKRRNRACQLGSCWCLRTAVACVKAVICNKTVCKVTFLCSYSCVPTASAVQHQGYASVSCLISLIFFFCRRVFIVIWRRCCNIFI